MATIHDVAAYILGKKGPMSAMKLQKLTYFSYGYHLAWEERRLFTEPFQAWANGPVSPALYAEHRGRFQLQPGQITGNVAALDGGERESVDIVMELMGGFTANQLSEMTHRDGPWVQARERAGARALERSAEPLHDAEIHEYFDALANQAD
jgi:uncharacterized phage-associated protein